MARILIADDSRPIRMLVRRTLSLDGHEIIEAEDGDEALACLLRDRPDVVVLDVIMPGPSGLDVCRRVRADPVLTHIGVIFLTGDVTSDELRLVGADVIFAKPFSPHALLAAVAALAPRADCDELSRTTMTSTPMTSPRRWPVHVLATH